MNIDLSIDAIKYMNVVVKSDKISTPNYFKHVLVEIEDVTDVALDRYMKKRKQQGEAQKVPQETPQKVSKVTPLYKKE